jgi:hypothetical protein
LFFSDPISVQKSRRYGGPYDFHFPKHQRQVERLSPKFNSLQKVLDEGRFSILTDPAGTDPEYTLVLEVAGDPNGFATAVRHLDDETGGMEWLFEVIDEAVTNDSDFFRTKNEERDDSKTMSFKFFGVLTNQRALKEVLSLWEKYSNDGGAPFPRGKTGLKNVFKTLRDIRLWGVNERLEETGILEAWVEDLQDPGITNVNCEVELFFRRSATMRDKAERAIRDCISSIGGKTLASSCIEEIRYHALLVSIPRQYAEMIIRQNEVELITLDQIMFLKPTGQSVVENAADAFELHEPEDSTPSFVDEPIIALFDGLPQANHPLLGAALAIDDPDGYAHSYQIESCQHGTSMASLIVRGDLADKSSAVMSRKIYVRPIMKPYPTSNNRTMEFVPEDILLVDKIHESVRRLFEPVAGGVAPTIRVINFSIGVGSRLYYNMISPLARLLDWLSFKYRVLFIVSAGNHVTDIDLGMDFDEFQNLSSDKRDEIMITKLDENERHMRLLSPAESLNSLTVGALFADSSPFEENPRQLIPCSEMLPSPISSVGRGINKAVKPDILFPGGRSVLVRDMLNTHNARWRRGTSVQPPGVLSAKPMSIAKASNTVGYSFGTSVSAALVTYNAGLCFDILDDIFAADNGMGVPYEYAALLLKAMLVHGAKWHEASNLMCRVMGLAGRGADRVHKWLGYGVPDIERVKECAKNRVTLIGYGELEQDCACEYVFPLPFDFTSQRFSRRLTVTLASFTPICPSTQKYRSAQLWYTLDDAGKELVPHRQDVEDKAVARGTIQHEHFHGNQAIVWGEEDNLTIKISCRADANSFTEPIPYALMATFDLAPEYEIDVYQRVASKIRLKEAIKP